MGPIRIVLYALGGLLFSNTNAFSQKVNPADNPLIGTWVSINKGYGSCDEKRTFSEHTQTWYVNGGAVNAPATYAISGDTIYVQQHIGSGGTVAYIVVSPNEIKDSLGTNACHWRRQ